MYIYYSISLYVYLILSDFETFFVSSCVAAAFYAAGDQEL